MSGLVTIISYCLEAIAKGDLMREERLRFGRGPAHACLAILFALPVAAALAAEDADQSAKTGPFYATPEDCPTFAKPEFLSTPLEKAYPGIEYNVRPAVRGGTHPYRFSLENAPVGMTINQRKGTVVWTPKAVGKHEILIRLTDAAGRKASQSYDLTVTKEGFYFVSPKGDDANPGTMDKPWKRVEHAHSGEGITDMATAIIYLRGGEYKINKPSEKRDAVNKLSIGGNKRPKRWIAFPGEKPVLDFGWSAEKQSAALLEDKKNGAKRPQTYKFGHRFVLWKGADGFYFDGLEVKNTCFYTFQMWNGLKNGTWRRMDLHHVYSDGHDNSAFIYGAAVGRKKSRHWGDRQPIDAYRNLVIQDCHLHDRIYTPEYPEHGGAVVFYTVHHSLVEDNLIERIAGTGAMATFCDKDSGWGNTYRGNVIRSPRAFSLMGQGYNDEAEICYNTLEGGITIGIAHGWVRNTWVHHNNIIGGVALMYGGIQPPPSNLAKDIDLSDICTPSMIRNMQELPAGKRSLHFYRNVVVPWSVDEKKHGSHFMFMGGEWYAKRYRFIRLEDNLIDSRMNIAIRLENRRDKSNRRPKGMDMLHPAGFSKSNIITKIALDAEGNLPAGSEHFGKYGRTAVHQEVGGQAGLEQGVFYYDGFESGDMSATNADGFAWGKNNCTSVVTAKMAVWNNGKIANPGPEGCDWRAKTGKHCLRFSYPPNKPWAEQRFDLGKPYRELWIRYWLRVPVNYTHELPRPGRPSNGKLLALWMDGYSQKGDGPTVLWNSWRSGEGSTNVTICHGAGEGTMFGHKQHKLFISVPRDRGRWMQVVYHVKAATDRKSNDGWFRMWRRWEDEPTFTKYTDLRNANAGPPPGGPEGWQRGYIMGYMNAAFKERTDFLIDDFTLSTESLLATGGKESRTRENRPAATGEPPLSESMRRQVAAEQEAGRILQLARQAERMGQRAVARSLFEQVIEKHPGTEAAKAAAKKL